MLDFSNLSESDLAEIDLRTISPQEWHAVKREVGRRAQAERTRIVRDAIRGLRSPWRNRPQSPRTAPQDQRARRLYAAGRA